MPKNLFDIIGEDLPFQNKNDKKFTDLHKVDKVKGLDEPTKDDKIFNATNVAKAKIKGGPGIDPMAPSVQNLPEGAMDVYGSIGGLKNDDDDDTAQRNQAIQDNMQAAQQYKQQGSGHSQLMQGHQQQGNDMNQDPKLRNLHKSLADLHNQLVNGYGKLSKYHDTKMQSIVSGGNQ